jgi:hypothetical protein
MVEPEYTAARLIREKGYDDAIKHATQIKWLSLLSKDVEYWNDVIKYLEEIR